VRHLIRASVIAACLAVLALPAGASHFGVHSFEDPWPMAGGGPAHESVADGPEPPYRTAWRAGIDAEPIAGPVVGQGIAVIVARGEVIALDPETGDERWRVDRERGPAGHPATVHGGVGLGGLGGPSTPGPGRVWAVDGEGEDTDLVGREAETGEVARRFPLDASSSGGVTIPTLPNVPTPSSIGSVIVGDRDGVLHARGREDGAEIWRAELGGRIDSAPAISEEIVLVTTQEIEERTGRVVALAARTGEETWSFAPEGNVAGFSSVTVVGGVAYVGTGDLSARALDAETGERLWETRTRAPFSPLTMPAIAGDAVVFADVLGHLYLLDRETGEERWLFRVPGFLTRGSPVVVGDHVVIGDDSGQVSAIDLETGHLVWRRDLGEGAAGAIATDGHRLILAPADGPVLALEHDPEGTLLDEPSPTTLFLATALLNYAAAFAAVLAGTLVLFRFLIKPREEG